MKYLSLIIIIISIVTSCKNSHQKRNNQRKKIEERIEKELASGVRHDTIFLDFRFGMSESEVREHINLLRKKDKIYVNEQNNYEYKFNFGEESVPSEALANIAPRYFNDKLYKLILSVESTESLPTSELCQLNLVNIYQSKYNNVIIKEPIIEDSSNEYIWIDGNRKIKIISTVTEARVIYTDLIAKQKKDKQDSIKSREKKESMKDDI